MQKHTYSDDHIKNLTNLLYVFTQQQMLTSGMRSAVTEIDRALMDQKAISWVKKAWLWKTSPAEKREVEKHLDRLKAASDDRNEVKISGLEFIHGVSVATALVEGGYDEHEMSFELFSSWYLSQCKASAS